MRNSTMLVASIIALAIFSIFAILVNSASAGCPCQAKTNEDLFALATEIPDATSNADTLKAEKTDISLESEKLAKESSNPRTPESMPVGALGKPAESAQSSQRPLSSGSISSSVTNIGSTGDSRIDAVVAGLDPESDIYKKRISKIRLILTGSENVVKAVANNNPAEAEIWRQSLRETVALLLDMGIDPTPFLPELERAGVSISPTGNRPVLQAIPQSPTPAEPARVAIITPAPAPEEPKAKPDCPTCEKYNIDNYPKAKAVLATQGIEEGSPEFTKAKNTLATLAVALEDFENALVKKDYEEALANKDKVIGARIVAEEIGIDISSFEEDFAVLDNPEVRKLETVRSSVYQEQVENAPANKAEMAEYNTPEIDQKPAIVKPQEPNTEFAPISERVINQNPSIIYDAEYFIKTYLPSTLKELNRLVRIYNSYFDQVRLERLDYTEVANELEDIKLEIEKIAPAEVIINNCAEVEKAYGLIAEDVALLNVETPYPLEYGIDLSFETAWETNDQEAMIKDFEAKIMAEYDSLKTLFDNTIDKQEKTKLEKEIIETSYKRAIEGLKLKISISKQNGNEEKVKQLQENIKKIEDAKKWDKTQSKLDKIKYAVSSFFPSLVLADCNRTTCNYVGDPSAATTSWQSVSGTVANGSSYNRYDFYVYAGNQYTFSLCSGDGSASASFDTYMCLYGMGYGCGYTTFLATNDDACGSPSRIIYTATSTGWTSLYVSGWSTSSGSYTLAYKYAGATSYSVAISNSYSGSPSDGTYYYSSGAYLYATPGTRSGYTCTGYTGSGSIASSSSDTYVSTYIYANSTLNWQWTAVGGPGCGNSNKGTLSPSCGNWNSASYSAGEIPYWTFSATSGYSYQFTNCPHATTEDTYLRIYNSVGTVVASNDDGGPFSTCAYNESSINWTCSTSGTYYVSLAHYSCSNMSYAGALRYMYMQGPFNNKGSITPSTSWQSTYYNSGETAYWSWSATAGTIYDFSFCPNSEDTYLRIFNSNWEYVTYADDGGPHCTGSPASISWTCPSTGTYYIYGSHYSCSNFSNSSYMQYKYQPSCTTPGTPVSLGGYGTGETTAYIYWSAGSPAGSATVTYYWNLYTSGGSSVTSGNTTGTSASVSSLTCGTSYYFTVYAYTSCNGTSSGTATSSTFSTYSCPTPGCGNTNLGTIYPSSCSMQTASYSAGTIPYWTFSGTAGTTYNFTLGTNSEDSYLHIYNSSLTEVATNDDYGPFYAGSPSSISYTCATSGTHYVTACHYVCNVFSNSGSMVYWSTPSPYGSSSIVTLYPSTSWQYQSYSSGNMYFYGFYATSGNIYDFSLCDNSEDSYLRIYDSGYNQVFTNDDSGPWCSGVPSSCSWTAPSSGTYYIQTSHCSCSGFSNSGSLAYKYQPPCTTPGTPVSLGASLGTTDGTFYWSAGSPAGSATVYYNYNIYNTSWSLITSGSTTSTSVYTSSLTCGTGYYLEVQAYTTCNYTYSSWASASWFYTGACCTTPSDPTASGTATICSGSSTNISATSTNATTIYWYTGGCGSTYIGTSSPGANFSVSPSSTTTYYARGYNSAGGGCWSSGCGSVTITVTPTPPPPTASADPITICPGSTSTLTASSGGGSTGPIKALIVYADGSDQGLNTYLTADSRFGSGNVTSWLATSTVPSVGDMTPYDVVITWGNNAYANSTTFGDNLKSYVDAGGGVVVCTFGHSNGGSFGISGGFLSNNYDPIQQTASYVSGSTSIGTISSPSHEIMSGVSSVTPGYYFQTTTLTSGASAIFYWANSYIGCAVKEIGSGRTVGLNQWPGGDGGTHSDLLIANAAAWAGKYGSSGSATIKWYSTSTGGTEFATGTSTTVSPTSTTTYYAEAQSGGGGGGSVKYYLRYSGSEPWGSTANTTAMNNVFGSGGWTLGYFETINVSTMLSNASFIYMDGSDAGANAMNSFISSNISAIESWVSSGGRLILKSAPNTGGNMNWGFGGTTLVYSGAESNVTGVNPAHAIFNTPYSTGTAFSGSSFSHAYITGSGLTSLILGNSYGYNVVCEKTWGSGLVLFSGATMPDYMTPSPNAANLFTNIVTYASSGGGGGASNNILGSVSHSNSSSGNYTLGYSFTPSSNITVTAVRRYFGSKISIWTDGGSLLGSQAVSGSDGTWTQTTLSTPINLTAGTTYRIAAYTNSGSYYWSYSLGSTFAHGTINTSYEISGDAFPTSTDGVMWWFVDLVYTTGGGSSSCPSARTPVTVTVNSNSTAPSSITGTTTICSGGSTTLSVSGGSLGTGANWRWYSGSCGVTSVGTGSSVTVSPTSNTTYFVRAEGTCNNTSCASTTVTVNAPSTSGLSSGDYVWTGISSTDWATASNWLTFNGTSLNTAGSAPTSSNNVFIRAASSPCATNTPVVSGTVYCKNLTIESGKTLNGGTGTINVYGNWTNSGTFTCGTSTVQFVGSATSEINSGGSSFYNIYVDKSTASTIVRPINNALTVNNYFQIRGGTYQDNGYTTNINNHFHIYGSEHPTYPVDATLQINGGGTVNVNNEANCYLYRGGRIDASSGTLNLSNALAIAYTGEGSGELYLSGTGVVYVDEHFVVYSSGSGLYGQMTGGTLRLGAAVTIEKVNSWSATGGTVEFVVGEAATVTPVVTASAWHYPSITIASGKTVTGSSSYLMELKRNWTNNGAFTHGNSTVTFSGTVGQTIGGTNATTFYNVNVTNTHADGVTILSTPGVAYWSNEINLPGTLSGGLKPTGTGYWQDATP